MATIQDIIRDQVSTHPIVLYMKGTPQVPQCGFSARAVELLQKAGAGDFLAVNVLADPQIREGIKVFSAWPTIPQLYVNGEFIGGADIMTDLFRQGDLQKLVSSAKSGEGK